MMGFFTSPRICIGLGSIEILSSLGLRRAWVLVDPTVAQAGGDRRVREELTKDTSEVGVSTAVRVPPTLASVEAALTAAAEFRPDGILAVGGGSTIDTAKAVWVRYAHPHVDLAGITPLSDLRLRDHARFIAIPTTSGSGSDATWMAHLSDDKGRLVELASRELIPDWSLLDPSLPATMPADLTVDSGMEAMAQALEALASTWATPISDALARGAVSTLFHQLPHVLRRPDDLELRLAVHSASTMAGLAVSNAQGGLVQAIAYALGPRTGLSHGRLMAILLPWVLEFNFPSAREAYTSLGNVVGMPAVQRASAFADAVRQLTHSLGVPSTLREAGVDVDALRAQRGDWIPVVQRSTSFGANPRIPSPGELAGLIDRAAAGTAPL